MFINLLNNYKGSNSCFCLFFQLLDLPVLIHILLNTTHHICPFVKGLQCVLCFHRYLSASWKLL